MSLSLVRRLRSPGLVRSLSSTAAASPAPAPAPAESTTSSSSASTTTDSIHSSDIAFKPTTDGWGFSPKYSSSWDRIFSKKKDETPKADSVRKEESVVTTVQVDARDLIALKRIIRDHGDHPEIEAVLRAAGWYR